MSNVDKYIASARSLSIVVLLLVITAVYVSVSDRQSSTVLSEARKLFAYWVLCEELQSEYEIFRVFDGAGNFKLSLSWETGHTNYYTGLGEINIRKLGDLYEVTLLQPDLRDSVFQQIPDLHLWAYQVGTKITSQSIFESVSIQKKRTFRMG